MATTFKRYATIAGVLLLTSCNNTPPPSPMQDPRGRWMGALVTEQGQCPDQTNSLLQINDTAIVFAPANGSVLLKGERTHDNKSFVAELGQRDQNRKPYKMVFEGYPVGNAIGGIYATPKCRAHIVMTRTRA